MCGVTRVDDHGLLWSLVISCVLLWSHMHFVQWTNIIPSLIYYSSLYVNCYTCKKTVMVAKRSAEHTHHWAQRACFKVLMHRAWKGLNPNTIHAHHYSHLKVHTLGKLSSTRFNTRSNSSWHISGWHCSTAVQNNGKWREMKTILYVNNNESSWGLSTASMCGSVNYSKVLPVIVY